MRLVDVRHEQTAVFAAEATAKLLRRPGAGGADGRARGDQRGERDHHRPLQRVAGGGPGGRAPTAGGARAASRSSTIRRWSRPSPSTPATVGESPTSPGGRPGAAAGRRARTAARCSSTRPGGAVLPGRAPSCPTPARRRRAEPDPDAIAAVARLLGAGERPVLVLGSDVWADRAEDAARRCAETLALPVVANGQGRGILARRRRAAGHPGPVARLRGRPTWWWWPEPRSTSGSATAASAAATAGPRPGWCTWPTPPASWPATCELAGSVAGDLGLVLDGLAEAVAARPRPPARHRALAPAPARPGRGRGRRRPRAARQRRRPDPPGAGLRRAAAGPDRRRGGDRRRRRLRLVRRPVRGAARARATGSTPGPTAASAPASATPSPPGSPARRPRSCCCWATARPGSR